MSIKVTDMAFGGFLDRMMSGQSNPFDISSVNEFNANAGVPSVAQPANFDFAVRRDVA